MNILAHHIIIDGIDHGFAIAHVADDRSAVTVLPYDGEVHSTTFFSGKVRITKKGCEYQIFIESINKYL